MKVLSLFDGISCGRVALERAGFEVERYAAFEIDKYAIKVSYKNYPDIERYGDVFEGDYKQFEGFDLLIGGSPCTFWSIAKQGRETGIDGEGGRFFREYVRALHESKCKYFLYENNHSIHKDIKAAISTALGVDYIMINSALVSAQQRKRCYWTNIPGITQPENKGILLNDILESGEGINTAKSGKSLTLVATYGKRAMSNILSNKSRRTTGVAEAYVLHSVADISMARTKPASASRGARTEKQTASQPPPRIIWLLFLFASATSAAQDRRSGFIRFMVNPSAFQLPAADKGQRPGFTKSTCPTGII